MEFKANLFIGRKIIFITPSIKAEIHKNQQICSPLSKKDSRVKTKYTKYQTYNPIQVWGGGGWLAGSG